MDQGLILLVRGVGVSGYFLLAQDCGDGRGLRERLEQVLDRQLLEEEAFEVGALEAVLGRGQAEGWDLHPQVLF